MLITVPTVGFNVEKFKSKLMSTTIKSISNIRTIVYVRMITTPLSFNTNAVLGPMLPESPVSDFPGGSGVSDDDPADQTAAAVVVDSTFCISRTFSVQFITQLHAFYCRLCKINKVILSTTMF